MEQNEFTPAPDTRKYKKPQIFREGTEKVLYC
jgi:hypothetical protein